MADSEVKETPATPEEKPTGPVAIVVKNFNGKGYREILKDPVTGKIVPKPKRMVTTLEVTQLGRKFLDMPVPDIKGLSKRSKKRIEMMFEMMYDISTNELAKTDPKYAMAASQAFEKLTRRIYGKETISDEEKDALSRAGVKIVVIPAPAIMNPEIVPSHQLVERPKKPSFIEAEIVSTNEPKQ